VFEKALVSGVQSADEYLGVFLTRLDGLRPSFEAPQNYLFAICCFCLPPARPVPLFPGAPVL
ncbi:unnamed protein product, partial [Closterium sp. NIES-54]